MDYRRVDDRIFCENVELNKNNLVKRLGDRVKIHYDYIKRRGSQINTDFLSIYGFSCVYCGIGMLFINRTDLEIDHFICESSFIKVDNGKEIVDRETAGNIKNLVSSCALCNKRKSNFLLSKQTAALLNIDQNFISMVFERDSKSFRILIKEEHKNNNEIVEFYNKLNLGSDLKRLEYLGLKIDNIINNKSLDSDTLSKLQAALIILIKKHNITYDVVLGS